MRCAHPCCSLRRSSTVPASRIAAELGMPRQYLEKVLGIMARNGSVTSQRGARGGFRLARPAADTMLAAIIAPFDSIAERPKCLLESRRCDGPTRCAAHPYWSGIATGIHDFFNTITIADLVGKNPTPQSDIRDPESS
jgi:Rrf2 family transcriptional regulator, cysteine metabolism repressor